MTILKSRDATVRGNGREEMGREQEKDRRREGEDERRARKALYQQKGKKRENCTAVNRDVV